MMVTMCGAEHPAMNTLKLPAVFPLRIDPPPLRMDDGGVRVGANSPLTTGRPPIAQHLPRRISSRAPITPPPGCTADPHIYRPFTGVR